MKKILPLILAICILSICSNITLAKDITSIRDYAIAPKWEDYVPLKYQNPRPFPKKGKNIGELVTGIVLTDLLITAPVGIPMIVHSSTKMKNQSWYERKQIFEKGLDEAENVTNPVERQEYYTNLLQTCKMTEKMRQKRLQEIIKEK